MNGETKEIWKSIPDFPGYEVSSLGQVRSYWRHKKGSIEWTLASKPERILKPFKDNYRRVNLSRSGIRHMFRVSQLVLMAFVGKPPDGLEICHNNGDPYDDRLENLRYDTHAANQRDLSRHFERHPDRYKLGGKLKESEVITIREKMAKGATVKELTKEFALSPNSIRAICRGKAYSHFSGPIFKRLPHIRRDKKSPSCTSKYRGVHRARNYWRAAIWIGGRGGRPLKLGDFETEEEAARAYDEKAKEIHGPHAVLNFPDQ